MSNPVVTVTNSIPTPSNTQTVRKTYTLNVFESINFFLYPTDQDHTNYDPTNMGEEFYLWYGVQGAMDNAPDLPPDFITDGVWKELQNAPSGFVTPNKSVMPKLFTPSTLMVDNGIDMPDNTQSAYWTSDYSTWHLLFNWVLDTFNGDSIDMTTGDWYKVAQIGSHFSSQYVSVKAKDDKQSTNTVVKHMESPTDPPTGDWDSSQLVVGGAFMLMLNVLGITPGQAGVEGLEDNRWSITITFGEVTMVIADASTMTVSIAGSDQKTTVNLAEGMSKEGPPQQTHMADKPPVLIGVYPCWNGIVVVSGSQDTPQVTNSAGTFCRKTNSASIQDPAYLGPDGFFNPQAPADVEVMSNDAVKVDFGTEMTVTSQNCRFEIAYLPRFFTKELTLDGWLLLSTDTEDSTYKYNIYTIYTKNGTTFDFISEPTLVDSGDAGTTPNTSYWYVEWDFAASTYLRHAGEIFGYVLETIQTNKFSIKNGNGNFSLTWSGGISGDSSPSTWTDYIKSVSVTTDKDGSSGSITVDKYGIAGQDAVANQSIGAIVLSATGGTDTVAGDIFYGLGMGVSNAENAGNATWTIPLIGLEKKLEDIALINPPFFDGEPLSTAVDYLCRYAGINYNMGFVTNSSVPLSASEEINSSRFDWKSGTSVKTALDEVMADVNCAYCVRNGTIFFYTLDDYGLPVTLGPDQSGDYDFTTIVETNQTPDFDDLRNYIVGLALRLVPEGTGTQIEQTPTFPELVAMTNETVPDVPWAKCLVQTYPAALSNDTLTALVTKLSTMSKHYQVSGKLTIPGNATIKPYDQWDEFVVVSVTHNLDMAAKTWTTDLEFARKAV